MKKLGGEKLCTKNQKVSELLYFLEQYRRLCWRNCTDSVQFLLLLTPHVALLGLHRSHFRFAFVFRVQPFLLSQRDLYSTPTVLTKIQSFPGDGLSCPTFCLDAHIEWLA